MGARDDLLAVPDQVLRNGDVGSAALVFMDFATNPKRWWTGFGDLDHAGHVWQGMGDLISISQVGQGMNLDAPGLTFGLAATAEMIGRVMAAEFEVEGRVVQVFEQLFLVTPRDGSMPWQPLGPPLALFVGTMEQMIFTAGGATQRLIELTCESFFVRRNAPPQGEMSDTDQRGRFSGDRGLERVALYENYATRWI